MRDTLGLRLPWLPAVWAVRSYLRPSTLKCWLSCLVTPLSVVLPKGLSCVKLMPSVARWPKPLTRLTSRWRCSTQGRVQLSVPFVRRLTRSFTLRKCARQLKIKRIWPFVKPWLMRFWWKTAKLSVFVQRPIKNMLLRPLSWRQGRPSVGKLSSVTSSTHQVLTTVWLLLTLLTISRNWASKSVVSRQEPLHVSRLLLSITMWQKFSQETKRLIISHTLHVMRIMSRIRCHAGWPIPMVPVMRLSKTTSTVHLCLQVWLREWDLVTVRRLKTRLCALRTRNATNSS